MAAPGDHTQVQLILPDGKVNEKDLGEFVKATGVASWGLDYQVCVSATRATAPLAEQGRRCASKLEFVLIFVFRGSLSLWRHLSVPPARRGRRSSQSWARRAAGRAR